MFDIGFPELLLIAAVGLVLFGAKRVPELAKALGQSVNAFKAGLRDLSGGTADVKSVIQKAVLDTKA